MLSPSKWFQHFLVLCITFIFTNINAQSNSSRNTIPFDDGWKFWLGDDQTAKKREFDDSKWRTLNVPHDWSIEEPVNPPPTGDNNSGFFTHGIGWYRKSLISPDATKKVVIEFDGIYMNSEVYINGQFLGRRPYGFIGFRYDLTEYLKKDGTPNTIAIRVDDSMDPSLRWYAGSGMYRHVRLITTSYTSFHLDGGVFVTTPIITKQSATVKADYVIDPNFFTEQDRQAWLKDPWLVKPRTATITLRSTIMDSGGKTIDTINTQVSMQSMKPGQKVSQQMNVPNPLLWSDNAPNLYLLKSTLLLDGQLLDETTTTFGIRSLEFNPDRGLLVNGISTKLKGVCLHQDAGSFGNAVPIEVWAYRLGILKEMGCNAIRPSHHPFAPEFYDLCDKLGFYVFNEAFDEWTRDWTLNYTENTRGKAKYGYHLYFNQWYETDLRAMLRRDRNHPSVIMYSIGNEIPDQFDDNGYKLAKKLMDICHEEDATRPATSACDQSYVSSRNGFMDQLDIMGYNYIARLYGDSTYVPERRRFPKSVFLGTETTHQINYWLGVRDNDYVIGDFLWTGIDYLGETRNYPSRGSTAGDIDIAGGKKSGFYQRAAYWRNDPTLQIFVLSGEKPRNQNSPPIGLLKWDWTQNTTYTVRAATNCEEVELFLNNKSLGKKAVSHNLYFNDWSVGFVPGTLKAVAYNKGKIVATSILKTATEATNLQITPLKLPIPASDIVLYEITTTDKTGLTVVDSNTPITIKVEGNAKLIGLDNGDLQYIEAFKTDTRKAYQGRLLVVIQKNISTSNNGDISIVATAGGFSSATLKIN